MDEHLVLGRAAALGGFRDWRQASHSYQWGDMGTDVMDKHFEHYSPNRFRPVLFSNHYPPTHLPTRRAWLGVFGGVGGERRARRYF